MKPRPYQNEALAGIRRQFESNNSTLLVMATGLGKTCVFSMLAKEMLPLGRVMVLAHRAELIYQAKKQLTNICGVEPDIEMADLHTGFSFKDSPIVIGTIQTQIAGMNGSGRMTKFNPMDFSLLVCDEADLSVAPSWKRTIDYYKRNPNLKILGVTATPDRADEESLGQIFQSVAYEYDIREGIQDGWLVDVHWKPVYVKGLDYSNINIVAGELNKGQLAEELERYENLHQMAEPVIKETADKKTLIFTISVKQAEMFAEILNRWKPDSAQWVCGETDKDERANLFNDYHLGRFQYLVNVGVASRGFDEPGIEYVVLGRPTKSRALCAQMIGRGTRTLPGVVDDIEDVIARKSAIALSEKPHLTVLDFVGNAGRHRLITPADVLGGNYSDAVLERAAKNIEEKGEGDVLSELEQAEKDLERERREKLKAEQDAQDRAKRDHIKVRAVYSTAKINPFDTLDIEPCREKGWHKGRPPTTKQVEYLQKVGVDTSGLSFTHASQVIDRLIKNRKEGLCTYKQAKLISRRGYDPKEYTFEKASELITQIAEREGWKK